MQRETLDTQRRILGLENSETLLSMNSLAVTLLRQGRYAEAEKLYRQAFDLQRRVLGPENPHTLATMGSLGWTVAQEGRYDRGREVGAGGIRNRAPCPRAGASGHADKHERHSCNLSREGRYSETEKSWQQLREIQRRAFGPDDVQTAVSTYNLACVVAREGRRDEALSLLREVIDHGLLPSLGLGIENDSDLQSLHGDPRFDAVVAHAKEHAAAAAKQQ